MNRLLTSTDLLDNTLRLMAFTASEEELDRLADWVLSAPIVVKPASNREHQLISQLTDEYGLTLGNVLQTAIQQQQTTTVQLAIDTRLPVGLLDNLLKDALFISNVPIVLLRNLLQNLQISFEVAQIAIQRTIRQLRKVATDQDDELYPNSLAFRRDNRENKVGEIRQKGRWLFENDEALTMYLSRLEELMNANQ